MLFSNQRIHRDNSESAESTANPWSSYSDMMAALLLVFVLIMFYFVYQYLDMQEVSTKALEEQQAQLIEQQALVEEQQAQLAEQQALVERQQVENEEMQTKLEHIVGIKASIISDLMVIFSEAGLDLQIDVQTGSITMDSNVLFDFGSNVLKPEGKAFLDSFIPLYISSLLESENSGYISEIIIEGHTDTVGSFNYNLDLSQKRAFSVAEYCLIMMESMHAGNLELLNTLRGLLTANGRSYSNPIYDNAGNVNMDASRRVEFKFRLKDAEMFEEMQQILKGEN